MTWATRTPPGKLFELLDLWIRLHPIVPVSAFYPKLAKPVRHTCNKDCRPHLIRSGDSFVCKVSGYVHECPPTGCSEMWLAKQGQYRVCELTGRQCEVYDETAETKGNAIEKGGDEDDVGGMDTEPAAVRPSLSEASSTEQQVQPTTTTTERPLKRMRLAKEGRIDNDDNMKSLQSNASHAIRDAIPELALPSRRDDLHQMVDEHVLYLWRVVAKTETYKQSSLTYKFAVHIQVVLDHMIDGFRFDKRVIVPQVEFVRQALTKGLNPAIRPPGTQQKKFFSKCIQELQASYGGRTDILETIARRG